VARDEAKAHQLRRLGARAVTIDLFDGAAVTTALRGCDAVCNLATHIPTTRRAMAPGGFRQNDRIRTELSRILVDAALANGTGRFLQESVTFLYTDGGDGWLDESASLDPPVYARTALVAEGNVRRFTEAGGDGVVLRFSVFYGPYSHTALDLMKFVRRRVVPMFGPDGYVSSIDTDDAAAAVVAALSAPAGTYNVTDDEPVRRREYVDALAAALDVKAPRLPPRWMGTLFGSRAAPVTRSHRVSNQRLRDATGWEPAHASVRTGWPAVVAEARTAGAIRR
jgi:nucleoside-diphosphate-sugar epimerase